MVMFGRGRKSRRPLRSRPVRPWVEAMEDRRLLSAVMPVVALHSDAQFLHPAATSSGVQGYSPDPVRHAYGFDQVSFNGTAADGSGQTIAIVDAFNDPNIASDLNVFDSQFGLPAA